MLSCFLCSEVLQTPEHLFSHIKNIHKRCGNNTFKCTLCRSIFSTFKTYKRHVKDTCYKNAGNDFDPTVNDAFAGLYQYDATITNFQQTMQKSALQLACKLSGNMNFARNVTYEIVADFQIYINELTQGIKTIITPLVEVENEIVINHVIEAIELSFNDVRSEYAFESTLKKMDVIRPLEVCELMTNQPGTENDDENQIDEGREERSYEERINVRQIDEPQLDEERVDEECYNLRKLKKDTTILMPIKFQMKKFLELPNVFEKIKTNTANIQAEGVLNHFINGTLWQNKLKSYDPNQNVMPYFYYSDGAQLNHQLGSHCKVGNETFGYFSFPTIPSEYQSRLDNIFVATLHSEECNKTYGNERCYNNLVEELNNLAHEGILLNIDGIETRVFFVLGLILGDNLELNCMLDFSKSFSANFYCRFCRLKRGVMQNTAKEDTTALRNRENYETDVMMEDASKTGIHKRSIFNEVESVHVVESSAVDLTHDVEEGILHYNLSEVLLYLIIEKKYFSLDTLNERVRTLQYGDNEKGNKPTRIEIKHLNARSFNMSASEMNCFAYHLGFMIGEFVPISDPVWQFYLTTMKFTDFCYLPSYTEEKLGQWQNTNEKMILDYMSLFKKKAKPKHHFSTHYPSKTRCFGPLRRIRTIRYEGKHKIMKNYTKNINSRKNISYSLGKKVQYNFASRLIDLRGLDDIIVVGKHKLTQMRNEHFELNIRPSAHLNRLNQQECFTTEKVTINGIIFSTKLYLPYVEQPNRFLYEIHKVILLSLYDVSSIFLICKIYNKIVIDEHFGCFSVDKRSLEQEMTVVNAKDFLSEHTYPTQLHNVNNRYLFRCKRF